MIKNKGITLIALVVTIIVLLILAGISIAMLTGSNGIITRVNEARIENVRGTEREQITLAYTAEKSILLEKRSTESVKAEDLESRLKTDGANVRTVEEEDENLIVTFQTGNVYYVDNNGQINDDVSGEPVEPPVLGEIEKPAEEINNQFIKYYGLIEIAWLDNNNNVIKNPMKITETELGGMTPVKWDGTPGNYEEKTTTVSDSSWYQYIPQPGNTETGGTSRWANAKATSGQDEAYFVWIPRYSYKIIYFDSPRDRNNYKADKTNQTGIIGYSTSHGMIDVSGDTPKIVTGTEPVNITGKVNTVGYRDYIPHPAFEFDGAKKGIWVGKYETGGYTKINIKPNVRSMTNKTVSNMFLASQEVKQLYNLAENLDSHLMKNVEWGAAAYLADSIYGRNGTEITMNVSEIKTGIAADTIYTESTDPNRKTHEYNTQKGILASTTGNIHGIYDMSGGAWEYVAAAINSNYMINPEYKALYDALKENPKYVETYDRESGEISSEGNFEANKNKYGDATHETSNGGDGPSGWYSDHGYYPVSSEFVFARGGAYFQERLTGLFAMIGQSGRANSQIGFRVVCTP